MKYKPLIVCLLIFVLSAGWSSSINAHQPSANKGEDFTTFLNQFTNSAAFQLSRIKFPLKSPIILLSEDGETEKKFPFTQEKWPLLEDGVFKQERYEQEDGSVYVAHFVVDEPKKKIFEAGFEESEIDLRVEFQLINGTWYVVDSYTGWYGFDLPAEELNESVKQVQEDNNIFKEMHP